MPVAQTNAALVMQENCADMTAHQVISLLLDGALERVAQAKGLIAEGNVEDKQIVVAKIRAIIGGLRSSLNLNDGGEIANNLDALYEYMINRIDGTSTVEEYGLMVELDKLLCEVKAGWDAIDAPDVAISA